MFIVSPAPPGYRLPSCLKFTSVAWGGGHGPRAQALEGAPAQLVGPNCKKKSRPRQIIKVTSLQSAVADAGYTKPGGGGRTPSPEGASLVGLCGGGGGGC